jgi:uncharacterized protein
LYPAEYILYLTHFHGDRDYFECHEILEEYWKHVDHGNKNSILVAFIQLAVSNYHYRRGNLKGAKKTLENALKIFSSKNESILSFGLNEQQLFLDIKRRLSDIDHLIPYKSNVLPVTDSLLFQKCQQSCVDRGFIWGTESDMSREDIVHRHKMRDRTSVIEERKLAIKLRKGNG